MASGTKRYRITETRYFDNAGLRLYQVGEEITVPADFKPARSWVEVKDEPAPATPEPAPEPPKGGKSKRASDGGPA